jgi:hypothetical protein
MLVVAAIGTLLLWLGADWFGWGLAELATRASDAVDPGLLRSLVRILIYLGLVGITGAVLYVIASAFHAS